MTNIASNYIKVEGMPNRELKWDDNKQRCKNCGEELVYDEQHRTWLHSHVGDYGYWCWTTHAEPIYTDLNTLRDKLKEEVAQEQNQGNLKGKVDGTQ